MMKQYFKNFKRSVVSNENTMESGDHYKNGESPKNRMSRNLLM
jgi:hypothetical protein